MQVQMQVFVEGLPIEQKIQRLEGQVRAIVYGDMMFAAAGEVRKGIRAATPVRTGKLKSTIKRERIPWHYPTLEGGFRKVARGAARVYGGARGSGAAYGVPVHYGHQGIPPTYFFTKGQEASLGGAFDAAASKAAESYDRVVNRLGSASERRRIDRLSVI